jgi:hypothetical protein
MHALSCKQSGKGAFYGSCRAGGFRKVDPCGSCSERDICSFIDQQQRTGSIERTPEAAGEMKHPGCIEPFFTQLEHNRARFPDRSGLAYRNSTGTQVFKAATDDEQAREALMSQVHMSEFQAR